MAWMWRITLHFQAAMAARQIVFVRHGLSKMNVALGRQPWGSPGFIDPDIRDAPLEPSGLAGARALREPLARDAADVELVVSSPLTRALATADAAFDDALTRGVPALALPLAGIVDGKAEKARLEKALGKVEKEAAGIEKKLGNPGFLAKAPEEVVEENRERLAEAALLGPGGLRCALRG